MIFLINPTCYHKMCESCVDRLFLNGSAPCPVAGCKRILRRQNFRVPTFADLALEREVDIRKKVAGVFNRREQDFESLRAYNDYLNDVEDITFDLINRNNEESAWAKVRDYEAANKAEIDQNRKLDALEAEQFRERVAEQQVASDRARAEAIREAQQERQDRNNARANVIESLAAGGDAQAVVREGQKALQKRVGQKTQTQTQTSNFKIAGLKKREVTGPEEAYDPFGGMGGGWEYVALPDTYDSWDKYLKAARTDAKYTAGGYDVGEFYTRAMVEAFSGLGVFVGKEMEAKEEKRAKKRRVVETSTAAAG